MLDEINLAVSVERSAGLERFVVPVRIDDLPFAEVRANLARKNIVDFNGNWAAGLAQLIGVLQEDDVPRTNSLTATATAEWRSRHLRSQHAIGHGPETLVSNWLPIVSFPSHVLMQDLSVERHRVKEIADSFNIPWFPYGRLIGTFAEAHVLQEHLDPSITVTTEYRIAVNRFLTGRSPELPGLLAREAHRLLTNMLRQSWNCKAAALGLVPYQAASGILIWYVPKGLMDRDQVTFVDADGKQRRRLLVGWSERRQLYWHFGVEAKPAIGRLPRFVMRSHVIFTSDGTQPVASKERMHALRRRFCRSWWNDRWRDLLLAFVSWLSGKDDFIALPCGGASSIALGRSLLKLSSPVSIYDDQPESEAFELSEELEPNDDGDADSESAKLEESWSGTDNAELDDISV
jgi:hypothetical protein